jgi:hypothetical protein
VFEGDLLEAVRFAHRESRLLLVYVEAGAAGGPPERTQQRQAAVRQALADKRVSGILRGDVIDAVLIYF